MKMKYTDLQNEIIKQYRIDICNGDKCKNDWRRTHAHIKERRICKWKQAASIRSTFDLLHEIGHIETTKSTMRRCEQEFYATVWAIEKINEYRLGHKITDSIKTLYQNYIWRELDRGIRRGGKGYPTKEQLTLKWKI